MSSSMPNKLPPGQGGSDSGDSGAGTATPVDLTQAQQQAATAGAYETGTAAPTKSPPSSGAASGSDGGATAWQNAKKVSALWTINQVRNSWVYIVGVGWRKYADNSDSAVVAFTTLGAHAKLVQSDVNYREEADLKIHEMYVW